MYRTHILLLLMTVCWLGLTKLVLTQDDDNVNDDFNQPDNFEANNFDENSAEIERNERFELRKLLGEGLVDNVEEEKKTAPEPVQPTKALKKPSRRIKGPKDSDSADSEESEENQEEDVDDVEDPAEDFVYDPWKHQFQDIFSDGTYAYGYSQPHGVRRYEHSLHSIYGLVVEGFWTQPKYHQHRLVYELQCYRADHNGYKPFPIQYLKHPPIVERDEKPDVDCFE